MLFSWKSDKFVMAAILFLFKFKGKVIFSWVKGAVPSFKKQHFDLLKIFIYQEFLYTVVL